MLTAGRHAVEGRSQPSADTLSRIDPDGAGIPGAQHIGVEGFGFSRVLYVAGAHCYFFRVGGFLAGMANSVNYAFVRWSGAATL